MIKSRIEHRFCKARWGEVRYTGNEKGCFERSPIGPGMRAALRLPRWRPPGIGVVSMDFRLAAVEVAEVEGK
jgi:hypothetical protein